MAPGQEEKATPRFIACRRVVSLSHPLHPGIPQWPGDPPVAVEPHAEFTSDGYFLRGISLGEHTGTHLNAPACFHEGGITVDQYPAESLIVPALVFDLTRPAGSDPDYLAATADVLAWERRSGRVPRGCVVLMYSGWQDRWGSPEEYLNLDREGGAHFPGFGVETVQFLLEQRGIAGIGIDTHGVDGGQDQTFAVNRLVLAEPRIVLENLANLDSLPPTGATLSIGPLPIRGGAGSPASVLAMVP
jgi:kynurenine formamidase